MAETMIRKAEMAGVLGSQRVRARRNLKDFSFLYVALLAAFASVAVLSAFLWSRLTVVNLGYEISKANTERAALIEQNKRLRVEFMKLKSPERIEKIAGGELDLISRTGAHIVTLK